ncbi:hypothetical protein pb186bvf_020933 [Paramecium bursaria]
MQKLFEQKSQQIKYLKFSGRGWVHPYICKQQSIFNYNKNQKQNDAIILQSKDENRKMIQLNTRFLSLDESLQNKIKINFIIKFKFSIWEFKCYITIQQLKYKYIVQQ